MNEQIVNDLRDVLSDILEAVGTGLPSRLRNRGINACLAHERALWEPVTVSEEQIRSSKFDLGRDLNRSIMMGTRPGRNPVKFSVGPVTLYQDMRTGECGAIEDGIYLKMDPSEWNKLAVADRTIHIREIFENRPEEMTGPECECGHTAYLVWTRKSIPWEEYIGVNRVRHNIEFPGHTYDLTTVCEQCGKETVKKGIVVLGDLGWDEFVKKGGNHPSAFMSLPKPDKPDIGEILDRVKTAIDGTGFQADFNEIAPGIKLPWLKSHRHIVVYPKEG